MAPVGTPSLSASISRTRTPCRLQHLANSELSVARLNVDSHNAVHGHYYSVPYRLLHEPVDVPSSTTTIAVFHNGVRVAAHARGDARGRHTTVAEHLPKAHQQHLEWSPIRILEWRHAWAQTWDLAAASSPSGRTPNCQRSW
jgi:transposase